MIVVEESPESSYGKDPRGRVFFSAKMEVGD